VQTCALPIFTRPFSFLLRRLRRDGPGHRRLHLFANAVNPARALLAAGALAMAACSPALAAESTFDAPAAKRVANEGEGLKTAIFAGGWVWCVGGVFGHTRGLTSSICGDHGGTAAAAQYGLVSAGGTGHAEAVKATYDPSFGRDEQLLRILFSVVADPSLKDRQGPDVGPQ